MTQRGTRSRPACENGKQGQKGILWETRERPRTGARRSRWPGTTGASEGAGPVGAGTDDPRTRGWSPSPIARHTVLPATTATQCDRPEASGAASTPSRDWGAARRRTIRPAAVLAQLLVAARDPRVPPPSRAWCCAAATTAPRPPSARAGRGEDSVNNRVLHPASWGISRGGTANRRRRAAERRHRRSVSRPGDGPGPMCPAAGSRPLRIGRIRCDRE